MSKHNKTSENHEQGNSSLGGVMPCFNSFPLFYCQHKGAQWNCPHYKVVEKDFYSIETKCRFTGIDGETCKNETCNAEACRLLLNEA